MGTALDRNADASQVGVGCARVSRWSGAFVPAVLPPRAAAPTRMSGPNLRMGLFDGLSKALNEAMANDDSYGKAVNPGFREGYDGPAQKTVTFKPSGAVVSTYGGERMGDVCVRGGVEVTYGCQKGTCGSCEVLLTADGEQSKIRVCQAVVPKSAGSALVVESDPVKGRARSLEWEKVKTSVPAGSGTVDRGPAPPPPQAPTEALPDGWQKATDPETGKVFFFNDKGVTQWETPTAPSA